MGESVCKWKYNSIYATNELLKIENHSDKKKNPTYFFLYKIINKMSEVLKSHLDPDIYNKYKKKCFFEMTLRSTLRLVKVSDGEFYTTLK